VNTSEREQLIIKLISAVMANATPNVTDPDKININLTVAMEMVDKVLVDYEILKIKKGRSR
jgi:hypothetical protein